MTWRKLLLRTFLFLILFVPLNHLVMRAYIYWTRSPYVYEASRRTFEAVQGDVSVVVLGDSHSLRAVNASHIAGAYNFAFKGESPILTYYKVSYYLSKGDFRPSLVIFPLDLHTFSAYRSDVAGLQDPGFWKHYVNYFELGQQKDMLTHMLTESAKAEFAYMGGLDEVIDIFYPQEPWEVAGMTAGFIPSEGDFSLHTLEKRQEIAIERTAKHFGGITYLDEDTIDYFYRLLDLLEEYGIQVVFVWYPITEEYYQAAAQYVPVADHAAQMSSLIDTHGDYLFLDLHAVFWEHPEYFDDSDHLNTRGADQFTQMLFNDLAEHGIHAGVTP